MQKLVPFIGPLIILLLYAAFIFFIRGKIPQSPNEFLLFIKTFYKDYGYYLIFFGAFFEATFLVSFFIPGSTVILLGAALSRTGVVEFPLVILLGTAGLVLGYTINYFLGKYGWYRVLSAFGLEKGIKNAEEKIKKHGAKAVLLGYISPGPAAFISTAAGILGMPFKKFLLISFFSQLFWAIFWGTLAYLFGTAVVEVILVNVIRYFIPIVIGTAIVILAVKLRKRFLSFFAM